ncbi:MarR family transcriptional regulator [Oceanidesulfovibrio indonesiensis]|uniref:MarR family transcriptional regulator n=1 Tax=Oceanidesulfovibrio indonesiensis TaxID=54767 RepID=A0A7M3MB31_9BACT|nr:MarR family transcriptional regulator [Oceanidesulfovibrio indonesiensis]TVM15174.1 MarR family transcriptional regulator [Oceanidesulfovibrio indonesiensis]
MADIDDLSRVIVEFYEKLSSWEHSVVRDQGMTLPQMHTLEILGVNQPLRMKELAQKMGVTTGTLTVQVDRLERAGMVRRRPHQEDRRSILVELTDTGRELFTEHHGLHEQLTRDITAGLTDEERDQLVDLLGRLTREF